MSLVAKGMLAVCLSIAKVYVLPNETPLHLLKGLTISSYLELKFQLQLTQEQTDQMQTMFSDSCAKRLEKVTDILNEASSLYNMLSTAGTCNVASWLAKNC